MSDPLVVGDSWLSGYDAWSYWSPDGLKRTNVLVGNVRIWIVTYSKHEPNHAELCTADWRRRASR